MSKSSSANKKVFLEIYTRTFKRPRLLKRCVDSLKVQTCQEFRHIIIDDKIGIGVREADRKIREVTPNSDYIWILDDDNFVSNPRFIETLKKVIEAQDYVLASGLEEKPVDEEHKKPDVVICSANYLGGVILPDREPFEEGHVDWINFVYSKKIWMKHRSAWDDKKFGDWAIINSVQKANPLKAYVKDVMLTYDRAMCGKTEEPFDVGALNGNDLDYNNMAIKTGAKVVCQRSCAGTGCSFSEGQIVTVTQENKNLIERLLREGIFKPQV